jgi:methyl-accepting chemotaxis protein
MLNTVRIPIDRKLALIYATLMATLLAVAGLAFVALQNLERGAERVATRYAQQLDTISDVQMLMFRISLEARHAMLVDTPQARDATFARIGEFRKQMLEKLTTFESRVTTEQGREGMARIRAADEAFWRLGGEVVGKIQAGDVRAAFTQLESELVPARDVMVGHIAELRQWQQQLVLQAVNDAMAEADRTKTGVAVVTTLGAAAAAWLAWSMVRMMRGAFARAQGVTRRIAGGDLTSEIWVRKGDEFGQLFESIVDMQQRLQQVVGRVRDVAARIVLSAQAIDEANQALAAASHTHADSVRATGDSTRRMHEAVGHSRDSVDRVHALAREAAEVAGHGGGVVGEVVSTMKSIDDASKRISDIVNVIDGIAFQTNILALNAAVEAARAGEQGRGFAVVAAEVRSLAQRCAQAAREVRSLIQDSVQRVDSGTVLADQAGQTMQRIVGSVSQVTELMQQVAASARSQSSDVGAVKGAVDHIGEATERSLAAVHRSSEASAALRSHAGELEAAVAAFNLSAGGR